MPIYEFFCRRCKKPFVQMMHVAEHDTGVPKCPKCKKKGEVEKRMSAFSAVTTRKSAGF